MQRICCDDKSHFTPKKFLNFQRHRFHFVYWNIYKYLNVRSVIFPIFQLSFFFGVPAKGSSSSLAVARYLRKNITVLLWAASWSVCRAKPRNALFKMTWDLGKYELTVLYNCTSTLVASRNVKQCETSKWQEICIVIYMFQFLHLTPDKKTTEQIRQSCVQKCMGHPTGLVPPSQLQPSIKQQLRTTCKLWPYKELTWSSKIPKTFKWSHRGLPSDHGSMFCVSDLCKDLGQGSWGLQRHIVQR